MRLAMFAAMAALLVAALCVPEAFGDVGAAVRARLRRRAGAHIVLFSLASRDDPELRALGRSGLAVSTAIGVGLLVAASFADGGAAGRAVGRSRSCSTAAARTCSASRAGSWCPGTSPSATG